MNKNIIFIVIGVVLIVAGYLALAKYKPQPVYNESDHGHSHKNEEALYAFGEGSEVRYIAQKKFFNKPTDIITGVNQSLTGGIFEEDDESLIMHAEISHESFITGNARRDSDVANLLGGPIEVESDSIAKEVTELVQKRFEGEINLKVTINNITKSIPFQIMASQVDGNIKVRGSSKLSISDFGLKAPSLINVYEVDNLLELEFEVTLVKN